MRRFVLALAAAVVLGVFSAGPADAQAKARGKNGNGPAFCRSGAGHPVHGRGWCIDKGWGLGHRDWRRVDFGEIIFRGPRHSGRIDRGGLIDILGDIIFGRLDEHRARIGLSAELEGRWLLPAAGPAVLQLWVGPIPLGEIVDHDRDAKADVVVLGFGR